MFVSAASKTTHNTHRLGMTHRAASFIMKGLVHCAHARQASLDGHISSQCRRPSGVISVTPVQEALQGQHAMSPRNPQGNALLECATSHRMQSFATWDQPHVIYERYFINVEVCVHLPCHSLRARLPRGWIDQRLRHWHSGCPTPAVSRYCRESRRRR